MKKLFILFFVMISIMLSSCVNNMRINTKNINHIDGSVLRIYAKQQTAATGIQNNPFADENAVPAFLEICKPSGNEFTCKDLVITLPPESD